MGFVTGKAGENMGDEIESRGNSTAGWLRTVKDGKDLRVRVLRETKDWDKFDEHYVPGGNYFPCTKTASCPGCTSENERIRKKSLRYIAPVIIVDEMGDCPDKNQVKALKCSRDLATDFLMKADRNGGSLLNHDWVIIRQGNDMHTKYSIEREDLTDFGVPLEEIALVDPEPILAGSFAAVWGTDATPQSNGERPVTVAEATAPRSIQGLQQAAQSLGGLKPASQLARGGVVESGPVSMKPVGDDVPPSDARPVEPEAARAQEDKDKVSEKTLRAMPPDMLRTFLAKHGITPEGDTTDEMVAWCLENLNK